MESTCKSKRASKKRTSSGLITIAILLFVPGFSTESAWAYVSTDAPSFTDWHWRPDVAIVAAFLSTVYVMGWRRLRKRNSQSTKKWQLLLYLASMTTICLALLSPIDALGSFLFMFHMTQHELLMMVAAPLLLLADPLPPFLWALPRRLRYRMGRLVAKDALVRRAMKTMTWIGVTLPLYMVNLWG
ncbi:MAG: cytochrome c oxidase assembly protein, partial [Candidatus Binatia bacterium]